MLAHSQLPADSFKLYAWRLTALVKAATAIVADGPDGRSKSWYKTRTELSHGSLGVLMGTSGGLLHFRRVCHGSSHYDHIQALRYGALRFA